MTDRLASVVDLATFGTGTMTVLELQIDSCRIAQDHGFWNTYDDIQSALDAACDGMCCGPDANLLNVIIDSKLMLAVGELSEAEDALRHNMPTPEFAEELADAIIRIADLAHKLGINLEAAIRAKQAYNEQRPHMHGKTF